MKTVTLSARVTLLQKQRLEAIAEALGISINGVINQLVANAQIEEVQRTEAVARLPIVEGSHNVSVLQD